MRIGHGYDLHRLEEGLPLIVGGVNIPFTHGSLGHSDGDVVIHALIDALLGSLALGDIGQHFPPSDQSLKGIDSMRMLLQVMDMVHEQRYAIVNLDVTIVCQRPKLSGYYLAMRTRISKALAVDMACVSIKSKTAEGLGDLGACRAIEAFAVVLVEKTVKETVE